MSFRSGNESGGRCRRRRGSPTGTQRCCVHRADHCRIRRGVKLSPRPVAHRAPALREGWRAPRNPGSTDNRRRRSIKCSARYWASTHEIAESSARNSWPSGKARSKPRAPSHYGTTSRREGELSKYSIYHNRNIRPAALRAWSVQPTSLGPVGAASAGVFRWALQPISFPALICISISWILRSPNFQG